MWALEGRWLPLYNFFNKQIEFYDPQGLPNWIHCMTISPFRNEWLTEEMVMR